MMIQMSMRLRQSVAVQKISKSSNFFQHKTFHRSFICQTQLVWMRLKIAT